MTYTVLTSAGNVIDCGLTTEEAAHALLTYDGHNYKLSNRGEDNPENYRLYVSRSGGGNACDYALWPRHNSEGKGDIVIWEKVIASGGVCGTYAMRDEDYNAMQSIK